MLGNGNGNMLALRVAEGFPLLEIMPFGLYS